MKKVETITIRTTKEQKEELIRFATKEQRTLGNYIYLLVVEHLEELTKNDK